MFNPPPQRGPFELTTPLRHEGLEPRGPALSVTQARCGGKSRRHKTLARAEEPRTSLHELCQRAEMHIWTQERPKARHCVSRAAWEDSRRPSTLAQRPSRSGQARDKHPQA